MLDANDIAVAQSCAASSRLVDYSPDDKPWDVHRAQVQALEGVLAGAGALEGLRVRLHHCSPYLGFAWQTDEETGECRLKLRQARFCRVRHCPVCQWRRSLMWKARFIQALPVIIEAHPKGRWLFLTLTVRNCAVGELRETLRSMNSAWNRLRLRPEFRSVLGWIRTTEVTRGKDGSAHPHFHCLLLVRPSYFKGGQYVTQARWAEVWRECARLDYLPVVDVRAVKGNDGAGVGAGVVDAARETLKYAAKPSDLLSGDDAWLFEYIKQVHRLRFVATGGALRNALREEEETEDDLRRADRENDDNDEEDAPLLLFDWQRHTRQYERR